MIFKLFKILFSNMYSLGSFFEDFKKSKKSAAKNIFFVLLFAFLFISLGKFYVQIMNLMYTVFSSSGNAEYTTIMGMLFTCVVVLLFGFCAIASTYFSGNGEEQLLTLPLKKHEIFGAKFALSFFNESLIGIIIMFISSYVFGKNEHLFANPMFYIGTILTAFAICLMVVMVIYIVLIVLLLIFPFLRKRSLLTGIASVVLVLLSACYGMFGSALGNPESTFNQADTYYVLINSMHSLCAKIPFIPFIAGGVSGKILPCLVLVGLCAVLIFAIIPLLSMGYIKTLEGFSDVKSKKLSVTQSKKILSEEIKIHSVFKTLYMRDLHTLWREPSFFANGPLLVVIFPLIMVVAIIFGMFSSGGAGAMDSVISSIKNNLDGTDKAVVVEASYYIALVLSGFIIFVGNSNNVAATAFSREGKDLLNLKAMPIKTDDLVKAKFFHALTYVIAEFVIFALMISLFWLFVGLPVNILAKSLFLSLLLCGSISVFLIFIDLFIDTARPKLNWENPQAAFKNNLNSLFSVLASLVIVAIFVILGFLLPKKEISIEIMAFLFIVLASPLGVVYYRYAAKKIPAMLC